MSLFGYYKAINATAWPRVSLILDTSLLSWRRYLYIITANTIEACVSCRSVFSSINLHGERTKEKRGENAFLRKEQAARKLSERTTSIISILLDVHIVDICLSFNARKFFFFFWTVPKKFSSESITNVAYVRRKLTVFPVIRSTLQVGAQLGYK